MQVNELLQAEREVNDMMKHMEEQERLDEVEKSLTEEEIAIVVQLGFKGLVEETIRSIQDRRNVSSDSTASVPDTATQVMDSVTEKVTDGQFQPELCKLSPILAPTQPETRQGNRRAVEEMARIGERFDREVPTDHRQFSPLETRLLLENPDFRAQTIARLNRQQKEVAAVIPGPGTVPGPQVTDKQAGTGTANRGGAGAQASVARLPPWQSGPA